MAVADSDLASASVEVSGMISGSDCEDVRRFDGYTADAELVPLWYAAKYVLVSGD